MVIIYLRYESPLMTLVTVGEAVIRSHIAKVGFM